MKRTVVIGLLGVTKDAATDRRGDRWARWRPSLSILQQDDLLVSRFELIHSAGWDGTRATICADMASVSPETEVKTSEVDLSRPWDFESVFAALHGWARAYSFDPDQEDYLVHITTGTHVAQICLFLLTESRHFPARLIQTGPPEPGRPHGAYSIIDLDLSRFDQIAARFQEERLESVDTLKSGIPTRNEAFNRQMVQMERVAVSTEEPILLLGPTGAGKSSLARRIYDVRKRRGRVKGALVEVNCAALRGDGAMSTLFGHRRGAFTGATHDRSGLLRGANHGVLFLDEIGDLGSDEQAMLLRALEEHRFLPLGSDDEVESRFQLIAGTNRDLRRDVVAGRFRDDLLSRIDVWTFRLPGLAERIEDLEPNLDYELELFARRHGRRVTFSREARSRYLEFATGPEASWPGNFRDLDASVTRLATLADGGRITGRDVEEEIGRLREVFRGAAGDSRGPDDGLRLLLGPRWEEVDRFDRVQLLEVVRVCKRSRTLSEAGRVLFSASRQRKHSTNDADRLRKYLKRFGLSFETL